MTAVEIAFQSIWMNVTSIYWHRSEEQRNLFCLNTFQTQETVSAVIATCVFYRDGTLTCFLKLQACTHVNFSSHLFWTLFQCMSVISDSVISVLSNLTISVSLHYITVTVWVLLRCWPQRGESLAKIETAVSLSKLCFLGSADIQCYETDKKKISS